MYHSWNRNALLINNLSGPICLFKPALVGVHRLRPAHEHQLLRSLRNVPLCFLAGCYFHIAEDPLGWHRPGIYMSDVWAFLPRGHDPCKWLPVDNWVAVKSRSFIAFCAFSVSLNLWLSLTFVYFLLSRVKWCFSYQRNHQLASWSTLCAVISVSQTISGRAKVRLSNSLPEYGR